MPPAPGATCRHLAEWTAAKLRWGLAVEQAAIDATNVYAVGPPRRQTTVVHYTTAP
ncbi:hypothetical protein [Streptomyces sp. NPDC126503]|uniref:hypothetical protein n=1 Tax=Streptomyces sp. NPDC126503 TaxID=3155315 RepID=UPI003317D0EF